MLHVSNSLYKLIYVCCHNIRIPQYNIVSNNGGLKYECQHYRHTWKSMYQRFVILIINKYVAYPVNNRESAEACSINTLTNSTRILHKNAFAGWFTKNSKCSEALKHTFLQDNHKCTLKQSTYGGVYLYV